MFCASTPPLGNSYVCCSILLPGKLRFTNRVSEMGLLDGCVIFNGVEGGTEVEGGVGEGRNSKFDQGFKMTSIDIGFSTTGGDSTGSLGSTQSMRSIIS